MADFCKQCSIEIFDEDYGDLAGIAVDDEFIDALCEGCGECIVDRDGRCIATNCMKRHGDEGQSK